MPQLLKIPSGNGDLVATASRLLFQIPAQATYSLIISGPFGMAFFSGMNTVFTPFYAHLWRSIQGTFVRTTVKEFALPDYIILIDFFGLLTLAEK